MGNFNRDRRSSSSFGRRDFGEARFDRNDGRRPDRQMFKAICSNCGRECEVPFRPTSGKPVYCSDCFEKFGPKRDSGKPERQDRPTRPDFARNSAPSFDQNKAQLDAINAKLDRLLNLLEPKNPTPIVPEPAVEEVKESLAPKKKAAKKATSKKKE